MYQADTILQFYDNQEPREEYYNDNDKMNVDSENKDYDNYDGNDYQ